MNIQDAIKAKIEGKDLKAFEILSLISKRKRTLNFHKECSEVFAEIITSAISIDMSNFEDPESVLSMLFSKSNLIKIDKPAIKTLQKIFVRPQAITLYSLGKEKFIVVTEDIGYYTIIGSKSFLSKFTMSIKKYSKPLGQNVPIQKASFKPDTTKKLNDILEG